MAAPFTLCRRLPALIKPPNSATLLKNKASKPPRHHDFIFNTSKPYSSQSKIQFNTSSWSVNLKSTFRVAAIVFSGGYAFRSIMKNWNIMKVYADEKRPAHEPSRKVRIDTDNSGLKLTIYQYQTCPFCCKTRALLDYYGFSYDIIEVNSISKKELQWSEYKKVPILIVQQDKEEVALHDSTVIMSILESYLHDRTTSIKTFNTYYPVLEEMIAGKKKLEFPNRYFVMFQEKSDIGSTPKQRVEERKWRRWTDEHLVHMLSPNAYRTIAESLESFNYFSEVGEWEKNFSFTERMMVIYLGAAVMYVLGKWLKHKYELKDDVRQSLYDACNEWVKAVGKDRPFMGGSQPNLADLSVYGVLHSIEGCAAFQDALQNSKIGSWYKRTKEAVNQHHGSSPFNTKTFPSGKPKDLVDLEKS